MKVALRKLLNAQQALQELAKEKLAPRTAYEILRNARKVEPVVKSEMETIQQTGQKMIDEKKAELGEKWMEDPKNKEVLDGMNKELDALLDDEVEVDVHLINLDLLTCQVTVGALADLDWMLSFPEDEPAKEPRKKHKK
jgi:hypothetical protein